MNKKNIIAIHQPSYFPWLGYLYKVSLSDEFVLLDSVQLADRAYQHRNIFLTRNGTTKILTININKKNYRQKKIKDIFLSDLIWQKNHSNFLYENYKNTPFFDEIFPEIKFIFEKKYVFLFDVLFDSIKLNFDFFGINKKILFQSEISEDISEKKENMLINITRKLSGTHYLSGTGILNYADIEKFDENGINLRIIKYPDFYYKQINAADFIEGLSSLDFLFNNGVVNAVKLIESFKKEL